jgi:SAM-dependent methyltransferase
MKNISAQESYWNKVANTKTFAHPIDLRRIEKLLSCDAAILDYGCGYGRTCSDLFHAGYHNVVGVDTSEQMIARGRREHPELNLQVLQDFKLKDASYDAVILFTVLTCIPDDSSQKLLVSEIWRILKPNGIIHISDLWIQEDEYHLAQYRDRQAKGYGYGIFNLSEGATFRHHRRDWVKNLLEDFETIETYDINVVTMNGNPAIGFQFLGRKPNSE